MPKKIIEGRVTNNCLDKTVSVVVKMRKLDRIYKKFVTVSKKFHAHDEKNECSIGDWVSIQESKPISKMKKWVIFKKVGEII